MRYVSHAIRRRCSILAAVLLCPAAAGCGADAAPGDDYALDAVPSLVPREEARIGSVDDPDYGFSRVGAVEVDVDGRIHVVEMSDLQIRVYSPDGRLLHRFGRRGDGPGEFRGGPRIGIIGDTIWAYDAGTDRITLFDRSGAVLASSRVEAVRVPLPESFGYLIPRAIDGNRRLISEMTRIASFAGDAPTGVRPTDRIRVPRVAYDLTGAVVDTVGWDDRPPPRMWRSPAEGGTDFRIIDVGGRRLEVPLPPSMLPSWHATHDGRVIFEERYAEEPRFSLTRVDLAGDTLWRTVVRYRPEPWTAEMLDSIAARGARHGRGFVPALSGAGPAPPPEDAAVAQRRLRAEMDFPVNRPAIEFSWLLQDGSVWLRRPTADDATVATWIVVAPDGRPRGTLELPVGTEIRWSEDRRFLASVPDEHGVPWLVRYRLE